MSKYFYWNGLKIVANMIKNGVITENKLATAVQTKLNAKELPTVTGADNGKILGVTEGAWGTVNAPTELPAVTSADNGDILQVVNGVWNKSSNTLHNYSTDEQIIGTWFDGKPIYEKTYEINSTTGLTIGTHRIDITDLNVETCIDVSGGADIGTALLPFSITMSGNSLNAYIEVNENDTKLLYNSSWNITSGAIVIQYTKTTDSATISEGE